MLRGLYLYGVQMLRAVDNYVEWVDECTEHIELPFMEVFNHRFEFEPHGFGKSNIKME